MIKSNGRQSYAVSIFTRNMKHGRCLIFILFLFAANVQAQTAKLTGTAVDSSGGLVVGADVTLLGPGDTTVAVTKTGPDGVFNLEAAPGAYALEISADGFEKMVQGISIAPASNRPVTVNLAI